MSMSMFMSLCAADFVQVYIAVPSLSHVLFPTVATFGSGAQLIANHPSPSEEEKKQDEEEKGGRESAHLHMAKPLIAATPLTGAGITNSSALVDSIALLERGTISFAAKVRNVQRCMAQGALVIQTEPNEKAWPYIMSDSTNSSGDITIPALMISRTDGEEVKRVMQQWDERKVDSKDRTIKIFTARKEICCAICYEKFEAGGKAVE